VNLIDFNMQTYTQLSPKRVFTSNLILYAGSISCVIMHRASALC